MRKSIIGLSALTVAAALSVMPAHAATRSFPVPGFTKLRVQGPFTVNVHTGNTNSVVARGPQNRIDRLVVENRGGTLVVSTENNWSWRSLSWGSNDKIIVDISVPMLDAAEMSGPGDLNIDRIRTTAFTASMNGPGNLTIARLDTSRLNAALTGPGDLTITGRTGRADLTLSGPGDLRAKGLAVDLLTATLNGPGDLTVGPTRVAKASLNGPGDIRIGGRPRCTQSKNGPGDIQCGD